ncbi:MAG: GFA family protein [Sneathiellaceae bacterium]
MTDAGADAKGLEGGCTCGAVRYRMLDAPMFVHCCHCSWCQRSSGSAFAVNALIEADRVILLQGRPEMVSTPTPSGAGQKTARCPQCRVALWSHYGRVGDAISFLRVGSLDRPALVPPDLHIHTDSRQPWTVIPPDARSVPVYYDLAEYWPAESLARRAHVRGEAP